MTPSFHRLPLFSVLVFAGCFSGTPEPDPCADTRRCVAADALGCCSGGAREVSVCEDSCPAGMIEETACRSAGCGMGCETPLTCRLDYGSGCCGDAVFTTSCDACPAGSVEASACTADFPAECGCGSIRGFRLPDSDAVGPVIPSECFEDLGGGCCGSFVGLSDCGACPTGTLTSLQCDMMSGDRIAPPMVACREDLGSGCCGAEVTPNACTASCPAGSIEASSCDELLGPGMDEAAFPAPSCFELTPEGCCGEVVPQTACGTCPAGSTNTCEACEP